MHVHEIFFQTSHTLCLHIPIKTNKHNLQINFLFHIPSRNHHWYVSENVTVKGHYPLKSRHGR